MAAVFTTSTSQPPHAALAALEHAKAKVNVEVKAGAKTSLAVGTATLSGASSAARYFARAGAPALLGSDYRQQAEVSQWIESAQSTTAATAGQLAKRVNEQLQVRTYLVGHSITLADLFVFYAVGNVDASLVNTTRWYATIAADSAVSKVKSTPAAAPAAKASASEPKQKQADQGKFVELEGAEVGNVVTRFPPEASGYLHIGHSKAAMLNQYFAKKYNGKLIMRFDDTNPAKESHEFEQVILEDLKLLQISYDHFSRTSDHFEILVCEPSSFYPRSISYSPPSSSMPNN